jgi:hypothetical protein
LLTFALKLGDGLVDFDIGRGIELVGDDLAFMQSRPCSHWRA